MLETLLQAAIEEVRAGRLSPATFAALLALAGMVWLAAKLGEKVIDAIGNLLSEGKNLRETLNEELGKAHTRADDMQDERDTAMRQLGEVQVELARCQIQLQHANARSSALAQDLIAAHQQLQDAQARLARFPT